MQVEITWPELFQAATVGVMRTVTALRRGASGKYGATRDAGWQIDVVGCIGELVVAKKLDMFWSGAVGTFNPGDVGNYEVRSTTNPRNTHMLLHEGDADDALFFLVIPTASPLVVDVHGPIHARDGKQERYWKTLNGRSAFWVPRDEVDRMVET
jgi:hypothetical protein